VRVWFLVFTLAALSWFQFGQTSSAAAVARRTIDLADSRPARSVLILGNSRTFVNDTPAMLRKVADSAGSPIKYQIETNAKPAFTFEDHWSDGRTRTLLNETWDEIVLQGESSSQSSVKQSESFKAYGKKLAQIAQVRSGRPTLLVNWPYDPSEFKNYGPYNRAEHLDFLETINVDLARSAGLDRVELAGLWESVRNSNPRIRLTQTHRRATDIALVRKCSFRRLSGWFPSDRARHLCARRD